LDQLVQALPEGRRALRKIVAGFAAENRRRSAQMLRRGVKKTAERLRRDEELRRRLARIDELIVAIRKMTRAQRRSGA